MAAPISYARGRGASSRFGFSVSQADIDRITNKLEKASGASLFTRMQKANLASADLIGRKAKQAAPRRTGNLRRSIKVRPERSSNRYYAPSALFGFGGRASVILVGPTAPHRHLVIQGTGYRSPIGRKPSSLYRQIPMFSNRGVGLMGGKVVRREGIANVGRMTPNPFMDRAKSGVERELGQRMAKEWRSLLR